MVCIKMDIGSTFNWPLITGELPYGWAGELVYPITQGFREHQALYAEMVGWIFRNIQNPTQNALWNKLGDCIYVQFRKRKDMMWFSLRFGQ